MATITLFNKFHEGTLKGEYQLEAAADTNVALLSATRTPVVTDTLWSALSTNEITGTGYTAGGAEIGNPTVSTAGIFDGDDVAWGPGASFTARWGVIYQVASGLLVGFIDLDSAPQTVTNGTFTIEWNSSGIIRSFSS
jgi:hypothetical protein